MTYVFLSMLPVLLVSSALFTSTLSEGNSEDEFVNSTQRFKRKPHYFLSTLPEILLPDIHFTFPAFDTQVPAVKEIDLSSNSIIRYTPVYEKQPLPTASHQHFDRILNKIKTFKRKLKSHRKKFLTTPQYSPLSAEPLAITPIVVPAYDYFPVGPDYLNQYLQISHKYDRQSCIYLKISEDSFMKVQCYPILPQTDQFETYPTWYNNEIYNNPDVANVYHTLVPNSPSSHPENIFYHVELSQSTSPSPYENSYYYQNAFSQHPPYSPFTPNPRPHHSAPVPHSPVASITTYSNPNNIFHSNKTSLPSSLILPSTSGHGNSTDKLLTTISNINGSPSSGTGFPVDNKSEMTPNNVPTKISLLNHAIAPLNIEPTQISSIDKMFFHPVDTVVVEASTEKLSTTSTEHNIHLTLPNELYSFPALGVMDILERPGNPNLPTYSNEIENGTPSASMTESSPSDKAIFEITESTRGTHAPVISPETSEQNKLNSESENRVFEPIEEIGTYTTLPGVFIKQIETTTHDRTEFYGTSTESHETTQTEYFVPKTENDLKREQTTESYDTAFTTDRSLDSIKELSTATTTTTDSYGKDGATITESLPDDLKQLPTTTTEPYDKDVASTTRSSTDDSRQMPTTTTEPYDKDVVTTTESSWDDLRRLPTTTTEPYDKDVVTTTESSWDDSRRLPATTTEPYDKDVVTSTESLTDDLRQLPTAIETTLENLIDGSIQMFTTTKSSTIIYNPTTYNNEELPLTTDDKITWFTSDIDDSLPKGTLPTLSLTRSDDPEESTVSTITIVDGRISTEKENITTPSVLITNSGLSTENAIKSIEDNEIISHQTFNENIDERIKSLLNNKLLNKVGGSLDLNAAKKNETLNTNNSEKANTSMNGKIDKNNILSLSSEDIKHDNAKIPLESDDRNIVKVLEKNVNTGNWEVQFYKVGTNNTSLNNEDIDMPRRSDVLISDYDGYDNIDSDVEEQYEYDYHPRNSSSDEAKLAYSNLGRKSLLNNEKITPNEKTLSHSDRYKRHGSISVEKLEQLNSFYEKMKENNSTMLSEIKDITQNNTENNNSTSLNVNYLDDFLKLTKKVKQYFDEKKEIKRVKRSVPRTRERRDFVNLHNEFIKNLEKAQLINGKRLGYTKFFEVNLKRPDRRKRNKRGTAMTNIIDNSVDIDHENNTAENIKTNTSMKHLFVPELLKNSSSEDSPHSLLSGLKIMIENNKDSFVNFSGIPPNKNSKFFNMKTTPNFTLMSQNEKSRFKHFNSTVFNFERKIETTTELHNEVFNVSVPGNNTNSTYIYKHKNSSEVEQNDLYAPPVPMVLPNVSYPLNLPEHVEQIDNRNLLSPEINNQMVSGKHNGNITSTREKYVVFFRNLKDALENNSTLINNSVKVSEIGDLNSTQLKNSSTNNVDHFNFKPGYNGKLAHTEFIDKTQHTINYIKRITNTLLLKQNVSDQDKGSLQGEVKQSTQPINTSSFELKLTIGETVNRTTSSDGIFVPMYVEMLLVVQITLLLALLAFFAFLHYADSRLNKRGQFDTSVTFLNNAFESERVFNDLP